MLHSAPQGDLYGHGIPVGHMDEPGHRAVDMLQVSPLGLSHHQLYRLGVALVELLHLGEHMDAGGNGILLHLELDMGLLGGPGLLLPAVQAHGVAADDVQQGIPVLPGLGQLLPGPGGLLPGHGELLLPLGQLLPHRLVPVQQLLGGGGQRGEQGSGLRGGGGLYGLFLPQGLQLVPQGPGALTDLPAGLLGGSQLVP